jgi:hypothetical protein
MDTDSTDGLKHAPRSPMLSSFSPKAHPAALSSRRAVLLWGPHCRAVPSVARD